MDVIVPKGRGFRGELTVPGDKSIGHRALMVAALAQGKSQLRRFPQSDDLMSTLSCVRALGVDCEFSRSTLSVTGKGLKGLRNPSSDLNAGNSGTTMRLLSGILSGQPFASILTGDESLSKRPMKRIIEPLSMMGARIESTADGTAPLRIRGRFPLRPLMYELPVASAQVKSAVLLAGLFADGVTTVVERNLSRDHTERMLTLAIKAGDGARTIAVQGGSVPTTLDMQIPGDVSSAAYLVAAALLIPGSQVMLRHIGLNPTRARVLEIFQSLGGNITIHEQGIERGEPVGNVEVTSSDLSGDVVLNGQDIPLLLEEIPVLAVVCALSSGRFEVRGAEELRHKESDRIRLLVENLRSIGIESEEYGDGFAFQGKKNVHGARITTQGDHRIAMAFSIAGLVSVGDIVISQAESTDVSFPGFWACLKQFSAS